MPESARFVALGWLPGFVLASLTTHPSTCPRPRPRPPPPPPPPPPRLFRPAVSLLHPSHPPPTHLLSLTLSLNPLFSSLSPTISSLRRPNTRYKRPGHSAPLPPSPPPPVSLLTVPGPDAASDRRQGPRAAKKLQVLLPSPICRGHRLASFSIPSPCRGSRSGIVRIICPNSVPCTDFSGIFSKPRFSLPSLDRPTD
ncbi:uncharacterized protein IWZ02DRAFT_436521 [Phyllosticta citriasiana]|uniref:uncharacterized protein n=1 Tax=Phyllosticta citriasiana TaxID=595635 RepID=UPI0030FDD96C